MRRALLLALALAGCRDQAAGGAAAGEPIRVVGSSTVFPFTELVAERFVARHPGAPAPVVESTGTGAGFRLFCAGLDGGAPAIADASRRITADEYRRCAANGAGALVEVAIGRDGIVFAQSRAAAPIALTPALLYRALAAAPGGRPNTARTWRALDPALPATPIEVYGPPATSGTRDAMLGLILLPGCRAVDPSASPAQCVRLREDGAYADAGESDNLTVQRLAREPGAIGVFGYSYLQANRASLRGLTLAGVTPSYATIARGAYPGTRALFLYVKRPLLAVMPALRAFLADYAASWAPGGPLVARGLVPAPALDRTFAAETIARALPLDPRTLR